MHPLVIYDVGGTLIRPRPTAAEIAGRATLLLGHEVPATRLEATMRAFEHRFRTIDWRHDDRIEDAWVGFYRDALLAADVRAPHGRLTAAGRELYAWYSDHDRWEPFPDAEPALASLRSHGVRQGAISNFASTLVPILHGLGLSQHLEFVVVSAVMKLQKPERSIFSLALRRARVRPGQRVYYVGDGYEHDVLGARAAGLTPVLLARAGRPPFPVDCPTIGSLNELQGLVLAGVA